MITKSKKFPAASKTKRVIIKRTFAAASPSLPKAIFKKSSFPAAPGGDRYEWKEAETTFEISKDGLFALKIEASAKDTKQNKPADDDDLRAALDGFDFGKYEQNREEGSWKSFNTSAGWNGASLKSGTKTVYYFVNLNKGPHTLQFFADETPSLKNIEVYEIKDHSFELSDLKPPEKIKSERNGIPWLSFVFLGAPSKNMVIGARVKSAKSKGGTDGDNLKVAVNGRILTNLQAPTSDKYKNFYFSGDLKEFDVLTLTDEQLSKPLAFENAMELWYDEGPEITSLKINFFNKEEFFKKYDLEDFRELVENEVFGLSLWFGKDRKGYSAEFLRHALKENPSTLIYQAGDPIASLIKTDSVYKKITEKLKKKIKMGVLEGEIWPEDFKDDPEMKGQINFDSFDLKTALHGIKKIEYAAQAVNKGLFDVEFVLFDIYDFEKKILPLLPLTKELFKQAMVNWIDLWEELGIVNNFEVEVHLTEHLNAD